MATIDVGKPSSRHVHVVEPHRFCDGRNEVSYVGPQNTAIAASGHMLKVAKTAGTYSQEDLVGSIAQWE